MHYLSLSSLPISGIAPNITAGPTDSSVIDGTSVILHCETSGAPRPAITWQKGQELISHLLRTHTPASTHFWQKEFYQVAFWSQIHQSHNRAYVIVGLIVDCSGLLINTGDICSQISCFKMLNPPHSASFFLRSILLNSELDELKGELNSRWELERTEVGENGAKFWREKKNTFCNILQRFSDILAAVN